MSGRGVIHLSLRYHATKSISVTFIHGGGTSDDWTGEFATVPCHAGHSEKMELNVLDFAAQIPRGMN